MESLHLKLEFQSQFTTWVAFGFGSRLSEIQLCGGSRVLGRFHRLARVAVFR